MVCITERRFRSCVENEFCQIVRYDIVRHDRAHDAGGGGGIAFYINQGLSYKIIPKAKGDTVAEYLAIEIGSNIAKCLVMCAFDAVNHHLLLKKLSSCFGVDPNTVKLVRSYLDNRCQYMKIGSSFSVVRRCKSDVSRDFILEPILFSIFIKDLVVKIAIFIYMGTMLKYLAHGACGASDSTN